MNRIAGIGLLGLGLLASASTASALEGEKTVSLVDASGERIDIATVMFEDKEGATAFSVTMAEEPFSDFFLSMRPFRCLTGPVKNWCHVPYPYENRRLLTEEDLTDLEYDLLFIWKNANDYGIDMWNGVYYKLSLDGEELTGSLHEMNMDILAIPPEEGNLRPVGEYDLEPGDVDSHWLPHLVIR